jgi:hypothetical protein
MALNQLQTHLCGKTIARASSNLTSFSLAFTDGSALLCQTSKNAGERKIITSLQSTDELPQIADAVCTVDWGWIYHSRVDRIKLEDDCIELTLSPAGPIKITLGMWQGSPFLCFHPVRAAQSTKS